MEPLPYLIGRWQKVKIGSAYSSWATVLKGVPQGLVLGPMLFNLFINIFSFLKKSKLYNYADDNTLSVIDKNMNDVVN